MRSVHMFVFNKKGQLLICKRTKTKRPYQEKLTSSAGGRVEKGESYCNAAMRELNEELGIRITLHDRGRFDVTNKYERSIHRLYLGTADKFRIDKMEIESCSFLDVNFLEQSTREEKELYADPFLQAFRHYIDTQKGLTYVIDFDHTLFNWYALKASLETLLRKELGVSEDLFRKAKRLAGRGERLYNVHHHLREVGKLANVPYARVLEVANSILEDQSSYVYEDARDFLERLSQAPGHKYLLSLGEHENQKFFIEQTGMNKYFDDVFITTRREGKKGFVEKLLQRGNFVVFINDDPKETFHIQHGNEEKFSAYLVERKGAKYHTIDSSDAWVVVKSLFELEVF